MRENRNEVWDNLDRRKAAKAANDGAAAGAGGSAAGGEDMFTRAGVAAE